MGIWEQLDKLIYLLAIEDAGSLSQAAKRLNIAQPSLSHSLKALESALGARLFLRTSVGTVPTEFGKRVLKLARKIERECLAFEKKSQKNSIVLRVAAKEPWAVASWSDFQTAVQKSQPSAKLQLLVCRSNEELLHALRAGNAELAIIPEPPDDADITGFEISRDRLAFFSSNEEIPHKAPIYAFSRAMAGRGKSVQQVLDSMGIQREQLRDVDSYTLAKTFLIEKGGTAILPMSLADKDVRNGRIRHVAYRPFHFSEVSICLCALDSNFSNRKLRALARDIVAQSQNSQ